MSLPNLFLAGAMKSGSTSLHAFLRHHPQICMSREKEPNYFIRGFPQASPSRDEWYFQHHGKTLGRKVEDYGTLENYEKLFEGTQDYPIVGESSVTYLAHPSAPKNIKTLIENPRFIFILREPVARAYSAWTYQRSLGWEPVKSFRDAIDQELSGERSDWPHGLRYFNTGCYARQLQNYFQEFPRERTLLLRFEELKDFEALGKKVSAFLGISDFDYVPPKAINVTRTRPKPVQLLDSLFYRSSLSNLVRRSVSKKFYGPVRFRINQLLKGLGSEPPAISEADKRFLAERYDAEVTDLEKLLGWDLSTWRHPQG